MYLSKFVKEAVLFVKLCLNPVL